MALNEQQKYLLNRLPNKHDYKHLDEQDPADVKKSRATIAAHDERVARQRLARERKFKKAIEAAREAIYFKPESEALKAVKALETEFLPS